MCTTTIFFYTREGTVVLPAPESTAFECIVCVCVLPRILLYCGIQTLQQADHKTFSHSRWTMRQSDVIQTLNPCCWHVAVPPNTLHTITVMAATLPRCTTLPHPEPPLHAPAADASPVLEDSLLTGIPDNHLWPRSIKVNSNEKTKLARLELNFSPNLTRTQLYGLSSEYKNMFTKPKKPVIMSLNRFDKIIRQTYTRRDLNTFTRLNWMRHQHPVEAEVRLP